MNRFLRNLVRNWLHIPDRIIVHRTQLIPEDRAHINELLKQYVDCMAVNARLIVEGRQLRKLYEELRNDFNS